MTARCYVSNLSKAWPIARQREVLASVAATKGAPEYRDELTRRGLQHKKPELLPDRAQMLRPTSRKASEKIYVAALPCLAINGPDLAVVIAAAAARRATIIAIADGLTIPPADPEHAQAAAQAQAIMAARGHAALTEDGRKKGVEAAAERRRAATQEALNKVRGDWPRPSAEVPTAALAARSGLTLKTLLAHLGPRKKAQAKAERAQQQRARRDALDADE